MIVLASVGMTSGAGAETVEQAAAPDMPAPLVAVELDNGNVVEFYEVEPGHLFVSEDGVVPNEPLHRRYPVSKMTPVELYRALVPDADVPQVLRNAQERALEIRGEATDEVVPDDLEPALDAVPALDGRATGESAARPAAAPCEEGWFAERFCEDGDWEVCWLTGTGGSHFLRTNNRWAKTAACPYRGNIILTYEYTDGGAWYTHGSWTILENHYRWAYRYDYGEPMSVRSEVSNAAGDGYHHSGHGFYFQD